MLTIAAWFVLSAALFFIIMTAAAWFKSSGITRPNRRTAVTVCPDQFRLPYETVEFTTADGIHLKGWFIPAESPGTIILCHGWGNNRGDSLRDTHFLHELGFNLFYFDFRASGESGGKTASIGCLESGDLDAAIGFLRENKPETIGHLGLYGNSMGSAVAICAAPRHPEIRCIASENTFCSYNKVVANWAWIKNRVPEFPLVPMTLFFVRMKLGLDPEISSPIYNIDKVSPIPLLLIHGDQDSLVTPREAKALYEKAGNPRELWIVPGAVHGKCAETGGAEYRRRLGEFFVKNLR
ncbi:MAG: alpha/beta hydrolase [bacterium]